MQRYLITFISLILLVTAKNSFAVATCSSSSGGNWIAAGNLIYQRDQAVGSWGGRKFGTAGAYDFSCTADTSADRDAYISLKTSSAPVAGYTDVYPTNISGVGVRYNFSSNSSIFCPVKFDDHIDNSVLTYTCHLMAGTTQSLSFGASIEFVKLNPSVASGVITTIPKVSVSYSLNHQAGVYDLPIMWNGTTNVNLTAVACTINASNISVPLGDVLATQFTGVGATPLTKGFNLGLNCDANAKVNVSLSGTANSDIANSDILALTNAGTAGVADGLGVQVLYNGAPLKRDTNLLLKTSAGGVETLPFSARYYQTKSAVKPGKASTTATLNLTYQ
ncbi:fimbrial protein [Serratia odorifera]|uniref:fimbrial protein n=1 Tax=Serratia odorifera TaxID=618 RepID=UPI002362B89B|nr:fimbrial protein [Serratia odorifera]